MRRFLASFTVAAALAGAAFAFVSACADSGDPEVPVRAEDGGIRRDGGIVEPGEGGGSADAGAPPGPSPSCEKYCGLVTQHCVDEHAQYESEKSCLALCGLLPPGDPGDQASHSLACRQYFAGTPAQTSADTYCLAAGPFGGGSCGDRCTAFCQLTLAACAPDKDAAPYATYPDCATACAGFTFRDAGADGGGEGPDGPSAGDTLNCRLYQLRQALAEPARCADLAVDSGACR